MPRGFGLGLPHQNAESDTGYYDRMRGMFNPSCTLNWKADDGDENAFPMVWCSEWIMTKTEEIRAAVDRHGNKLWLLNNEPEVRSQANVSPRDAGEHIWTWREEIDAPFALPGILWSESGRLWWESFRRHGGPKPDVYHIHIYAYDAHRWYTQLHEARAYFDDRPLIITECGAWYGSPRVQAEVMEQAWKAVHVYDLADAIFWFSSHYGSFKPFWAPTDLHDWEGKITAVGRTFDSFASREIYTTYLPAMAA